MDISEIKKRVREIVEEEFEVSLLGHLDEQILFDGELMRDSIGTINLIVRIEDMFDSSCYDQIVIKRISYIDYFRLSLIRFRDYVENYFLKKRD